MSKDSSIKLFNKFCWALVVYTVLVIIWGAWVRISHSGDGCGNKWPLCEGVFIPDNPTNKTLIEYFHRLTSGFYGLYVMGLTFAAFRIFPQNSAARKISFATFFFDGR
jgi:cytochrome c oxidase assembly protein subunit 15